ncbi:hypothetical protein ACKVMT_00545 [Halobacteriales archaeon Cl-PHB]
MEELLAELAEPLAVVVYAVVAVALTAIGLLAEVAGLTGVSHGLTAHTGWLVYVGLIALVAGGLVTRDKLLPALRSR